jgi:MFS family permease
MLITHCMIDQTSGTAVSSAIPVMKEQLGFDTVQAVWLISAFSLTFASFLLLSGRMSDLFNPSAARVPPCVRN